MFGYDIQKVDVYQERFIVARTQGTLMLGDLESCKLSEIPWESDLTERFFFDSDKVKPAVLIQHTVLIQQSLRGVMLCLVPSQHCAHDRAMHSHLPQLHDTAATSGFMQICPAQRHQHPC